MNDQRVKSQTLSPPLDSPTPLRGEVCQQTSYKTEGIPGKKGCQQRTRGGEEEESMRRARGMETEEGEEEGDDEETEEGEWGGRGVEGEAGRGGGGGGGEEVVKSRKRMRRRRRERWRGTGRERRREGIKRRWRRRRSSSRRSSRRSPGGCSQAEGGCTLGRLGVRTLASRPTSASQDAAQPAASSERLHLERHRGNGPTTPRGGRLCFASPPPPPTLCALLFPP